jgi:hypothetical protein
MPSAELKRTLQTLACAKYKILTKHPKGRDVNDTDAFSFNSAFSCPLAKIKIATIAAKVETDAERRETESKVDEARNTQCDVSSFPPPPPLPLLTFYSPSSTFLLLAGLRRPRHEEPQNFDPSRTRHRGDQATGAPLSAVAADDQAEY